ncbi:winged helix-turn-helix transcriptional regulator [Streptomyces sp. NPDC058320]|uniref:LexA family protein n=1 Tax=unclassified Streptomyces TaxID=2593676 RepID=UPI0036274875
MCPRTAAASRISSCRSSTGVRTASDNGEALTVREIAATVGLASPSSALYQLRRLEEAGIVRRARGAGSRGYRLS